ncbi:MAG: DHA2 family efflux MFS transporter permease subunit [Dehalococcoidia bacterium]
MSTNRYILFGVVSLGMLLASMQGSMIGVAFADIGEGLSAPDRWVGWVIAIFTLAQAVSMPTAGKLSDELGRRTVFVGGVCIFLAASVVCAAAPNVYVLIAARAVQGLAGGSLLPSAYGVLGDAFDAESRARAIGMLSSVFPIGGILGPNLGGFIVEHLGWRWTFLVNLPLGIVVVVAALVLMPAATNRQRRPIDFMGVAFLSLAVTGVVYALTELSQTSGGAHPVVVVSAFAVALLAGVLFLRHEARTPEPILELQLLRRREFAFMNALNFFYGFVIFGLFSFIPLYAQTAYDMSKSTSGVLLTPRAIAMIVASSLGAFLLPKTGYRKPIMVGMVGMGLTLIVMSRGLHDPVIAGVEVSNFTYLGTLAALSGFFFGVSGPAANNAAIELAPDRIAAITGLRGMFRSVGGSIGTSLVVLVMSHAATREEGLEQAFLGLAVAAVLVSFLVLGIPDRAVQRSSARAPSAGAASPGAAGDS